MKLRKYFNAKSRKENNFLLKMLNLFKIFIPESKKVIICKIIDKKIDKRQQSSDD
jgi:hypothetical protein